MTATVNRDILSLARQAGFDELESEDIEDVLASHTEELSNEDLQQLTEHSPIEDNDEEEPQRTLTSKRLAESFNMFQQPMPILIDDDPNRERNFHVQPGSERVKRFSYFKRNIWQQALLSRPLKHEEYSRKPAQPSSLFECTVQSKIT
ncbi:putative Tigger transposable element-derived protein 1-like 232 [Homarus americanus]|uniref:Putative Tigger transposable element-derived protein 1-like 232 n=1 Tax=Homarus americanus TaxID=6706 RepID=A0A8J5JKF4_HOMAM|nr:putative Tigger transposable element-derived protein 1-like 232 [Homarus americanus]